MKKTMVIAGALVVLIFAPHALAQSNFVPLAPIPGLTQGVVADSSGLVNFFNNLYKYLIGLSAVLAIIMIMWGGIEIAMNKDDVSKITDSKGKIYNAIYGLILVLSPFLVFSIINPNILNLSLNLPALDTRSAQLPPATPCTSNCDTLNVGQAGATNPLYACNGADCTGAKQQCFTYSKAQYQGESVCANGTSIDRAGAISYNNDLISACKSGETIQIYCIPPANVLGM